MNDTIIGLGNPGASIIRILNSLDLKMNYFLFSSEEMKLEKNIHHVKIPNFKHLEEYETKFPKISKYFKNLNGDIFFIVSGGEDLSFSSLVILEQVKKFFENIIVIYIQPELEILSQTSLTKENVTFNILQEYARSGAFKQLILISNSEINKLLGGLSILSYQNKISETIAHMFYFIYKFQKMKPVFNTFHELPIAARICTISIIDFNSKLETSLFNLDNVTDVMYYFGHSKESLEKDLSLFEKIKEMLKNNTDNNKRISYGVFAVNGTNDMVYNLKYTSTIQKREA